MDQVCSFAVELYLVNEGLSSGSGLPRCLIRRIEAKEQPDDREDDGTGDTKCHEDAVGRERNDFEHVGLTASILGTVDPNGRTALNPIRTVGSPAPAAVTTPCCERGHAPDVPPFVRNHP